MIRERMVRYVWMRGLMPIHSPTVEEIKVSKKVKNLLWFLVSRVWEEGVTQNVAKQNLD